MLPLQGSLNSLSSTAWFISGTASSVGGGFRDWAERVSRGRETVITSDNSSSLEVSSSCAVTWVVVFVVAAGLLGVVLV